MSPPPQEANQKEVHVISKGDSQVWEGPKGKRKNVHKQATALYAIESEKIERAKKDKQTQKR